LASTDFSFNAWLSDEKMTNGMATSDPPKLCPKKSFCTKIDFRGAQEFGKWSCIDRDETCGTVLGQYSDARETLTPEKPVVKFKSACENDKKMDGVECPPLGSDSVVAGEFASLRDCVTMIR
jgi:hypothetical protein